MSLYETLNKYKKRRKAFLKGDEYAFFMANRHLMNKLQKFSYLNKKDNSEFDIMRMNILFKAYLNKETIENEVTNLESYIENGEKIDKETYISTIHDRIVDAPYIDDGKSKIYIPFFSKVINLIYTEDPMKLAKFPYSDLKDNFFDAIVDPFDTYGYELYNSYFTRLIKVEERDGTAAFFHYDTNTIYIINEQGRLDCKIVLFDRFLRRPNYNHMLDRLKPVLDAYYKNDKALFLNQLKKNGFLSSHLFFLIKLFDWRKSK